MLEEVLNVFGLWQMILYLFIPDVIRACRSWFLHGNQAEHLEQVVLHNISLVIVTSGTGGHTKDNEMALVTIIKIISDHVLVLLV